MKDSELKNLLKDIAVPPPSEQAKNLALERARLVFEQTKRIPRTERPSPNAWFFGFSQKSLVFASGIFAGALLVYVLMYMGRHQPQQKWPQVVAKEQKIFSEMQNLFPNKIRAVVSTDLGDPSNKHLDREVLLTEEPRHFSSQPVVVEVTKDGKKVRIVTFSGESIEVDINGKKEKFEILLTGENHVVVVGENFVWNSGSSRKIPGRRLEAQALREQRL